jgi:hypothetical protein
MRTKWLIVTSVVLACPMLCGLQPQKDDVGHKRNQNTDSAKHVGFAPGPGQASGNSTNQNPANGADRNEANSVNLVSVPEKIPSEPKRDPFDLFIGFCTAVLTVVGVAGTCAAIKTLKAINRQAAIMQHHSKSLKRLSVAARDNAEASRDAASAAKDNAEAARIASETLINAERPWIIPKIRKTIKWIDSIELDAESGKAKPIQRRAVYFTFSISNQGRTPAEVFAIQGQPNLTDKGIHGGLTDPPDYGLDIHFDHVIMLAPRGRWDYTDIGLDIRDLGEETFKLLTAEGPRWHWRFKGRVLYRDVFKPQVVHESRFCYTYFNMREDYLPSGPPGHTGYT